MRHVYIYNYTYVHIYIYLIDDLQCISTAYLNIGNPANPGIEVMADSPWHGSLSCFARGRNPRSWDAGRGMGDAELGRREMGPKKSGGFLSVSRFLIIFLVFVFRINSNAIHI